jgi:hypothetical protein
MKTWLEGKKTYIAAVAGIVLALALLYLGFITTDAAVEIIVFCVVSCGFRSAFTGAVARRIAEIVAEAAAARRTPPGTKALPPGGGTN